MAHHFDEHYLFNGAKQMFNSGLFLPRWYGYPTFSFYVALLPSLKYVASYQDELDANNVLQYVGTLIEHDGYLARVLTVD